MRNLITIMVFAITALSAFAQNADTNSRDNIAFTQVETFPVYAGCEAVDKINQQECFDKNVMEAVSKNFKYPASAKQHGVEGEVVVSFIIEKDGSIKDITLFKGLDDNYTDTEKAAAARDIERAALNSVKDLKIISPALKSGKPVRMKYTVPIQAKLKA